MKRMKKALALLMVLIMAMLLFTATAFATGTGTITIENSTYGKTYKIYKVFDATYDTAANSAAYTIKKSEEITDIKTWYDLVTDAASPFQLSEKTVQGTTDTYVVTLKTGKTGDDVLAWFTKLDYTSDTFPKCTAMKEGTGSALENNMLQFTGLDNGYYYVTSELGTTVTLTNLNNNVKIVDKNQTPSWDNGETKGGKFIKGDDGTWTTSNTAAIGDTLEYKLVLNSAPNYTKDGQILEYQFVDHEADAVLIDLHSVKVSVDGTEITDGWIKGYDSEKADSSTAGTWYRVGDEAHESATTETPKYNWYIENAQYGDDLFTIHIKWNKWDTGEPLYPEINTSKIEITYNAILEGDASVGKDTSSNTNSVTPRWSTSNGGTRSGREKTVYTTTFGVAVEKRDGNTGSILPGVEFELKASGSSAAIKVYPSKTRPGHYYAVNTNKQYSDDVDQSNDPTTILTTNSIGKFLIIGLKGGTYTLTETKALDGYNPIADTTITLAVPSSSSSSGDNDGWQEVGGVSALQFDINNYKGTVLPETGSTGTKMFILFGSIAVLGAGIILVANKRMRKENF